jgi:hypothetical protein
VYRKSTVSAGIAAAAVDPSRPPAAKFAVTAKATHPALTYRQHSVRADKATE